MLVPLLKLVVCFSTTDNIVSFAKLFAHDTSVFSAINDVKYFCKWTKKGSEKKYEWFYNWKMSFRPDLRSGFF